MTANKKLEGNSSSNYNIDQINLAQIHTVPNM